MHRTVIHLAGSLALSLPQSPHLLTLGKQDALDFDTCPHHLSNSSEVTLVHAEEDLGDEETEERGSLKPVCEEDLGDSAS